MLHFCAKFKNLSPYNSWLAQLQMPGARYVLSEEEWKNKYKRVLKPHARPIIILVPFGPISVVFEIGDTISEQTSRSLFGKILTDNEILEKLEAPLRIRKKIDSKTVDRLLENLCFSGIKFGNFNVASSFGAEIRIDNNYILSIPIGRENTIEVKNDYLISANSNADKSQVFSSVCHELGHLFCHHLKEPNTKFKVRNLTKNEKEFEAETVSWLLCERQGLENPSEHYLSHYVNKDGSIPNISMSLVLQAVNEIKHMMQDSPSQALERGLLWKYRKGFKEDVRKIRKLQH